MQKFGTAVILAGGQSRRMGFDKQFLEINKIRLLDVLLNVLGKEFEDIIIVTNKPQEYNLNNIRVFEDDIKNKGPLSGIYTGLKESKSEYVYFMACDMPVISLDYIRYLKQRLNSVEFDVCISKRDELIEPFAGFYSRKIMALVKDSILQDKLSIHNLLSGLNCVYIEPGDYERFGADLFVNLNTEDDLNFFCKRYGEFA
ncbi:molybdenum cofactor guanylyltransferase [bacterium]|nr:molybdenum cofactor guanylyltransferase [bacterium]